MLLEGPRLDRARGSGIRGSRDVRKRNRGRGAVAASSAPREQSSAARTGDLARRRIAGRVVATRAQEPEAQPHDVPPGDVHVAPPSSPALGDTSDVLLQLRAEWDRVLPMVNSATFVITIHLHRARWHRRHDPWRREHEHLWCTLGGRQAAQGTGAPARPEPEAPYAVEPGRAPLRGCAVGGAGAKGARPVRTPVAPPGCGSVSGARPAGRGPETAGRARVGD